jgi:hypothetical protein
MLILMKPPSIVKRSVFKGRKYLTRSAGLIFFRGDHVECPCCGNTFRQFQSFRGPNRICWSCGSLERHRTVALFFDQNPQLLEPGMRMLHVAPEPALAARFALVPGITYIGGDFGQVFAPTHVDITNLEFPDCSLDAVVCNHVLEHVPDDRKAMREIGRVLKDNGWAMLLVPLSDNPNTDEDSSVTASAERLRRFGQRDHVRCYGRDYFDRLRAEGLHVSVTDMGQIISSEVVERYRLRSLQGQIDAIPIASRTS